MQKYINTPLKITAKRHGRQGFLLITLMITTVVILLVVVATIQIIIQNQNISLRDTSKLQSQFAADSGADYGIEQILADANWSGTSGEVELSNDASARTTYEVAVDSPPGNETKTLTVTGRTYVPSSSLTAKSTSKVEIGLRGSGASGVDGEISAYIGVGGLVMSGSALITDGVVFSNGGITMSGSTRIGSSSSPLDTYVVNMSCPAGGGSGYPRLCSPGENDDPINIPSWATFIYGEVRANNQIDGSGMASPGLVSGTVAPSSLPSESRASRISTINASGETQSGATASCGGTTQKTWPANLKITGNVTLGGSCILTVPGDVWITGNLTLSGSAQMRVQTGLTVPPHIMIDGSTGYRIQNSGGLIPNSDDTGFRIITYYSADSCSTTESGCEVTGTALYNSRYITTISISGGTSSLKTQYYARWSEVEMTGSADVGAIIGQTIDLSGTAEIHAGVSIDPSEEGTLTWAVDSYKRVF